MSTHTGIALVGPMASGKTTIARALIDLYGFAPLGMISAFRELFAEAYPGLGKGDEITVRQDIPGGRGATRTVTLTGRGLMQAFGEFTRQADSDFWPKVALGRARGQMDAGIRVVSDDVRFPTEADLCRRNGLLIVRVDTPEEVRMARYEAAHGRLPSPAEQAAPTEVAMAAIETDTVIDGTRPPAEAAALLADTIGAPRRVSVRKD